MSPAPSSSNMPAAGASGTSSQGTARNFKLLPTHVGRWEEGALRERERESERERERGLSPAPLPPYTEDSRGYVRKHGRSQPLGRIYSWGSTLKAVCGIHGSRCTRMYSYRTVPEGNVLVHWLFAGLDCSMAAHMGLPKPMKE